MFDIGFSELLVIGIVALVVIGPERLPKVARTVGGWLGKLNRYAAQVKEDVNREMKLEELQKIQAEMKDTAQKYEIIAAETEVTLKRDLNPEERLSVSLGVTDSVEAQTAKADVEGETHLEAAGPHAIIEYAHPEIDRLPVDDGLNETIEAEAMTADMPETDPASIALAEAPIEAPRQTALF